MSRSSHSIIPCSVYVFCHESKTSTCYRYGGLILIPRQKWCNNVFLNSSCRLAFEIKFYYQSSIFNNLFSQSILRHHPWHKYFITNTNFWEKAGDGDLRGPLGDRSVHRSQIMLMWCANASFARMQIRAQLHFHFLVDRILLSFTGNFSN